MPGNPSLTCPVPPPPFFFGVDLVELQPSTLFINPALAFNVTAKLLIGGLFAAALTAAPGQAFTFTAYFESFGGTAPEGTLGSYVGNTSTTAFVASATCAGATEYALTIAVPPATLPAGTATYKLTGTLIFGPGLPAAAFAEGAVFVTI
jgi:hypothetical protein